MLIQNLSKIYHTKNDIITVALSDVNLSIPQTGLVVVLGKSGSGKSTLLNILGGIEMPTSGSVKLNDVDITKLSERNKEIYREKNVGFVFQNFNLFEQLSVYENITFCMPTANAIDKKRVDTLLTQLEIYECKHKKINELSGGQQQRVAICRALMKDCSILLADEPTGNLDEINSETIFAILKECAKDKLVIAVTHDNEMAEKYADYVIKLKDGMVIETNLPHKDVIHNDTTIDLKAAKSNGNFKTNAKMSFSFLIKKKFKMIFSMILMAVSLAVMAVTYMCYKYDLGDMGAGVLLAQKENYMSVARGYIHPDSDKFQTNTRMPINDELLDDLINTYSLEDVSIAHSVLFKISDNNTSNKYYSNYIGTAICTTAEGLTKYGFDLKYGSYPNEIGEVAITDIMANSIAEQQPLLLAKLLGVYSVDALMDDNVLREKLLLLDESLLQAVLGEEYNDSIQKAETLAFIRKNFGLLLLNQSVSFGIKDFVISGIINTNYNELYGDIIYGGAKDKVRVRELDTLFNELYCSIYVPQDTALKDLYTDMQYLPMSNCRFIARSKFDRIDNLPQLAENEILMSRNYFTQYFGESFDPAKVGQYQYKTNISMTVIPNEKYETLYNKDDWNVVGVFDDSTQAEIVVNDNDLLELCAGQSYIKYVHFDKLEDKNTLTSLINDLYHNEMHFSSANSFFVYEIANIMEIFKLVFIILSGVLGVFSAIMFYNYFSMLIENQKKEIGIMRALGVPYRRISTICVIAGVFITTIVIALSWVLTGVLGVVADNILIENLIQFSAAGTISGLHVLKFGVMPFVLPLLIGVVIAILAIFIPNLKIKKLLPINAIRNE